MVHNLTRRSEYHTQLAKMSFDKIFDLTAGVYFNCYNNLFRSGRLCLPRLKGMDLFIGLASIFSWVKVILFWVSSRRRAVSVSCLFPPHLPEDTTNFGVLPKHAKTCHYSEKNSPTLFCCYHVNSHNQVRGRGTGFQSLWSGGKPQEKNTNKTQSGTRAYIMADAIHASAKKI